MSAQLAPLLLLTAAFAAQDAIQDEVREKKEEFRVEDLKADRALISVDRKQARGEGMGLFMREPQGRMKRIWTREPYDACSLINRTILIGERWTGRVVWIDWDSEILWEKSGFQRPVDVELGPDDSIVVVENGANRVVCVDTETGKTRWVRTGLNEPFDCEVLTDGGLLVADSGNGRVVEFDKMGKVRFETRGLGFPNTVEKLENGGVLVGTWSAGEVIELDKQGKLVWRTRLGGTIYSAERRPDGITTAVDGANGRIFFLDRLGRLVKTERFQPGCVDYDTVEEL
jgi:hypothetical protein